MTFTSPAESCGIPIFAWLIGYFLIQLLQLWLNAFRLRRYRDTTEPRMVKLLIFGVCEALSMLWLVYGNILYYRSDNNCETKAHF